MIHSYRRINSDKLLVTSHAESDFKSIAMNELSQALNGSDFENQPRTIYFRQIIDGGLDRYFSFSEIDSDKFSSEIAFGRYGKGIKKNELDLLDLPDSTTVKYMGKQGSGTSAFL